MLWFGDTLIATDNQCPQEQIPDYAFWQQIKFNSDISESVWCQSIKSYSHKEIFYEGYDITIKWSPKLESSHLLEFFLYAQRTACFLDLASWNKWLWNAIPEKCKLFDLFQSDSPVYKIIAKYTSTNSTIQKLRSVEVIDGWLIDRSYKRIDEDITSTDAIYLVATDKAYYLIHCYQQTLH